MRQMRIGLGLAVVLVVAGCTTGSKWGVVRNPPPEPVLGPPPTAAALVNYLNDNARRVQAVRCSELDLDCREGLRSVSLRGQMVCQKPRNFRMGAKVVGNQQVDIGSNDQEFWYWIAKADPPYLFHCSYNDFEHGAVRMQLPFQPDWLVEALGIADYGQADKYQVRESGTSLELVEQTVSPQGGHVRKVTVFSRTPSRGTTPQVTAHLLQDANGRLICGAYVTEVQQDRATGAILPRRVRLVWPDQQLEMKLKLDEVAVNPRIDGEQSARLFTRPKLVDTQTFDLARDSYLGSGQIRRARGSMP